MFFTSCQSQPQHEHPSGLRLKINSPLHQSSQDGLSRVVVVVGERERENIGFPVAHRICPSELYDRPSRMERERESGSWQLIAYAH